MEAVRRLIALGWPINDAITFCASMRLDPEGLEDFVENEEEKANETLHKLQP